MVSVVCISLAAMLSGCGRGGSARTDGVTIAVVGRATPEEFWKLVHAGAVKAGRELNVRVTWAAPHRDDGAEQSAMIEQSVRDRVGGMIVAPVDGGILRGSVHDAAAAGISVIALDADASGDDAVSFITIDHFKAGEMAGDQLAKLLGPVSDTKRKVLLLHDAGSVAIAHREEGFLNAIKGHTGIDVATADAALSSDDDARAILNRFKDSHDNLTIDGIYCPTESTTTAMLHALKDTRWAGKVLFIGSDATPELVQAVQSGQVQALVVQDAFYLGEMSIKALVGYLQGGRVDKRIDLAATLVTEENLADPQVDAMLHPDTDRWLQPSSPTTPPREQNALQ